MRYHPDKQKQSGQDSKNEEKDFFACITKAFDILSDPVKRRSYDSIDPTFNDDVPSVSESSKKNFYKVFAPVFESNSRFLTHEPQY